MAGLLTVAVAGYALLSTPTRYVSETLVAFAPVRTDVQFEPSITSSSTGADLASAAHRQALVDLIATSAVEADVQRRLDYQLSGPERRPGALLPRIHASLRPRSEIISIRAEGDFPNDSLVLANAWAQAYVDFASRIYSGQESLLQLQDQRDRAQARAQAAQLELESNLATSQIERLQSQVAADEAQLQQLSLSSGRTDYALMQFTALNDLAQTARRFQMTRHVAQVFLDNADAGGHAIDSATLQMLEAQLVSSTRTPGGLQFQFRVDPSASAATDLRNLVQSIAARQNQVDLALGELQTAVESSRRSQVDQLQSELRTLRADYSAGNAERTQLRLRRDLATDTYQALARKVEELRVSDMVVQREVLIASPAARAFVAPRPVAQPLILAVIAGLAVVLIGIILKRFVRLDRRGFTSASAVAAD